MTFDVAYGLVGAVTDDTQMALFTLEGLIRAYVRQSLRGLCHPPGVVHHAYRRWLATQDRSFDRLSECEDLDGWLIGERRLWARRAPGNTCLSALRAARSFGTPATNNSKGCGTVMRDAPFGFLLPIVGSVSRVFELAVETAQTTHGHPSAAFSSGALAAIIAHICEGNAVRAAVERTLPMLGRHEDAGEVHRALEKALRLSEHNNWRGRLPELGQGWVAEEALAIAVLCALAADTARDAIVAAVNHDGDSDSTGSITGNIVGALLGPSCLSQQWTAQVELRDVIEALAEDFTAVIEDRADPEQLSRRYPGH